MQPPTDSLYHQNLKLAEFIASGRRTQAPPPAYSNTTPAPPALSDDQLADYDDDDDDYPSSYAPITINIDASLKIEGHGNTIILPPSGSSPTTRPSASPEQRSAETRDGPQQPSRKGRVERVTGMVLTALKDAGLLTPIPGVDGQMRRRRVDLHVNAGIVLKGSRNTVCTGMPKLMKSTVTGPDAKEKTEAEKDECAMTTGETQKRRACSEPPEVVSAKKARCS